MFPKGYINLSPHAKRIPKLTYTVCVLWEKEESWGDLWVDGKTSLTSDIGTALKAPNSFGRR
jgi:hypothetical protein